MVCPLERGDSAELCVGFANLFGNADEPVGCVEFLVYGGFAEYGCEVSGSHGLHGCGVEYLRRANVCCDVIPFFWDVIHGKGRTTVFGEHRSRCGFGVFKICAFYFTNIH